MPPRGIFQIMDRRILNPIDRRMNQLLTSRNRVLRAGDRAFQRLFGTPQVGRPEAFVGVPAHLTSGRDIPRIDANIMMMAANGAEAVVPPAPPANPQLAQPQITSARRPSSGRGKLIAAYTIAPIAAGALSLIHAATDVAMLVTRIFGYPHAMLGLSNAAAIAISAAANASLALLIVGGIHLLTRARRSKEAAPVVQPPPAEPIIADSQTKVSNVEGPSDNKILHSINSIMAKTYEPNLADLSQAHTDLRTLRGHIKKGQVPAELEESADKRVNELTETIRRISLAEHLVFRGQDKDLGTKEYFIRPATDKSQQNVSKDGSQAPLIPNAYYLGRGAMGEVYRGVDAETGEPVALKMLIDLTYKNRFATDFSNMSRINTELDTDSVVRVYAHGGYQAGASRAFPMIAMEFVRWNDLKQVIAEQILSRDQAIKIAAKISRTMAEVHGLGISHRDLKPANIFVDLPNQGEPSIKIADFGLAKDIDDKNATKTGIYVGTMAFSAPYVMTDYSAQHADQKNPDTLFKNDRYSLGVIAYQMMTGYSLVWERENGDLVYIGSENIGERGTNHATIEAIDIIQYSADYASYRRAMADGNTVEANRIQARWNLVQDFTELSGVRARIKIAGDIFSIIHKLVAFDPNEGFQDFQQVENDLNRIAQGLQPDRAGMAHAPTRMSELPAEPGATRVVGRESAETIGSQDVLMVDSTGLEQVLDRLDLDRDGKVEALSDIVFETMDIFSTLTAEERDQLMIRMSQIKLTARREDDQELLGLVEDAMQYILVNG